MSNIFLTKPYTFMSSVNTSGFNNFSLGDFKHISPEQSQKMIGFYQAYTEKTHDFRIMTARIADEVAKLRKKFDSSPSEKLQQIIAQKEDYLKQLNQILEKTREAYFSEGQSIAERANAYLSLSV
jgi:ElaB/YqjD/DUF883 family membrane-anchored ribosome-binding protein